MARYNEKVLSKEAWWLLLMAAIIMIVFILLGILLILPAYALADKARGRVYSNLPFAVAAGTFVLAVMIGSSLSFRYRLQAHQLLALVEVNRKVDGLENELEHVKGLLIAGLAERKPCDNALVDDSPSRTAVMRTPPARRE